MTASPRDSAHRCLADERRRRVLAFLRDTTNGIASLEELVAHVVAHEDDAPAPDSETVAITLYHVHLPMLADHGVIDFDERAGTVRYRPPAELARLIDRRVTPACTC